MEKLVSWKEHQGKRYLCVDLRELSRERLVQAIEAYVHALEGQADGTVCVLALASEFEFHPEMFTKARAAMLQQQGKVKRSALVNMGGILKVAFEGYYEVAKMLGWALDEHGKHFKTEEEALEWLLKD